MRTRRLLAISLALVAPIALAGCVALPPAAPSQTEPPAVESQQPTESDDPGDSSEPSEPAESGEPAESDDPGTAGTSTVTIDGQPAGSWADSIDCLVFGDGALLSSDSEDESGNMLGTLQQEGGAWQGVGFLITEGDALYFQRDETVPATLEGDQLSIEFVATDISGSEATVAIAATCS